MSSDFSEPAVIEALERQISGRPVVERATELTSYLRSPELKPVTIVRTDGNAIVLDLSRGSMMLGEPLSGLAVDRFSRLIEKAMAAAGTGFAFGRWAERREVYSNDLFASDATEAIRDVHLGIDVFCSSGTPVHAPLDGVVRIKANNAQELDYGPLLILEHESRDGDAFFSLYGHLAAKSVASIEEGQRIAAGEKIAEIGAPPENGNWPPHLHFQLILDLLELDAAFPGVAFAGQLDMWLALSPLPDRFFPECAPEALDAYRDHDRAS